MNLSEKAIERDSSIVLKKLFAIYEKNIDSSGLYDKLYCQLQQYKPFQLNKLKTELLAEEATKNASTLAMSSAAMIISIMTIIFNVFTNIFSGKEGVITETVVLTIGVLVLLWKFGNIFGDFIGKRKNIWKRNKYILCVIENVLNEANTYSSLR
ncbi:hypothetical protein C3B58_13300 [Lactonifactor longoviformis]|uniref:SMODS and SLOG-associating 2TM effector domain-containing protein n=1 Tax=Lactonifactor longoviformis DSM 17459 TaxID=1122155 RepID=A0A1M4ZAQ0_9CLOT|nr:hypothetical protein [Lactonifactor longoviformis]POP32140.1 hypothetical protein C3B58_13300 [Lactonifactor longoviformis]SHF14842.1 hypothetical protein SAMN02745158_02688 [Lactonifactor longoviformis DSM 17459]